MTTGDKRLPGGMTPPGRDDILAELSKYGLQARGEIRLIDTSHGADDIRLNCVIDRRWVLRFTNAPEMTEKRLSELNRLIDRYVRFGLKCPRFLTDPDGVFFHRWGDLTCYLQAYIDLPTAEGLEPGQREAVWQEVLDSVAGFAERYRGVDLIDTMGMYSLFDLAPFDIPEGIDEKQQNFNRLMKALHELGQSPLAQRLEARHARVRDELRSVYRDLPRCVFQADENLSNVLVDESNHLAGLIDFNMAGTEVIVNQFANLGGGFREAVTEPIGADARLRYAADSYRAYQGRMLQIYRATELEKRALNGYTWIAWVAGWPKLCFFLDGLKRDGLRDEILELLGLLAGEGAV